LFFEVWGRAAVGGSKNRKPAKAGPRAEAAPTTCFVRRRSGGHGSRGSTKWPRRDNPKKTRSSRAVQTPRLVGAHARLADAGLLLCGLRRRRATRRRWPRRDGVALGRDRSGREQALASGQDHRRPRGEAHQQVEARTLYADLIRQSKWNVERTDPLRAGTLLWLPPLRRSGLLDRPRLRRVALDPSPWPDGSRKLEPPLGDSTPCANQWTNVDDDYGRDVTYAPFHRFARSA